ncbi:DUF3870 domain-containing protein [Ammoniphilus sp. YIM 78166]|uniref:DUF3870 domain-containing protein n=1 Tax=Ammoniphilus sp. YIM 78166 TaxID=1644106 RepID=UPI001431844E|nr:DUF3870 domain-containing protein [Ammoniphilus sp. YIM 78166]
MLSTDTLRDPNLVYFVGNGSVPVNTAVGHLHPHIAVGLIIDMRSSQVLDAHVTLASPLAVDFIKAQIIGRTFEQEFDEIMNSMERYQGPAQKAILVALRSAYDRFRNYTLKMNNSIGSV